MNNRFRYLSMIFVLLLFVFSCNENHPEGDEFCWSPSGDKLAMISLETNELLIVTFDQDNLPKISQIDKLSSTKERFTDLAWSFDDQFLLYGQSSNGAVKVYSTQTQQTRQLKHLTMRHKNRTFPGWSPVENFLLWTENAAPHKINVLTCTPDGKKLQQVASLQAAEVVPQWSANGQSIYLSIYEQAGAEKNGLWRLSKNGGQRELVLQVENIMKVQVSPNGQHLAVIKKVEFRTVKKNKKKKTSCEYQIAVIDSSGKPTKVSWKSKSEVSDMKWSPAGQYLAWFEEEESGSNIWWADVQSGEQLKLTMENAESLFGWGTDGQLFFTVVSPPELIEISEIQKEQIDFSEAIRSIIHQNLFITYHDKKLTKADKNIYAYRASVLKNRVAYFKRTKQDILGSEVYCPMVVLADSQIHCIARRSEEYLAAADEFYLKHQHEAALKHLSKYTELDLLTGNLQEMLAVPAVAQVEPDSMKQKFLADLFENGIWIRIFLNLQHIDRQEDADRLFQQYCRYFEDRLNQDDKNDHVFDEFFWGTIGVYGKYAEFQTGINDFEKILASTQPDSTFRTYTYFAQSLLATENKNYLFALTRLKAALQIAPMSLIEEINIVDLLNLQPGIHSPSKDHQLTVSALQVIVERFPENKEIQQIYKMLGDTYQTAGKSREAFQAYQSAVTTKFDQYAIWNKIFELEQE